MFKPAITLILAATLTITHTGRAFADEPERILGGDGLSLAVYETGAPEAPSILFIHGFTQNHLSWGPQFSGALADEFRLVALDLRGHGASDKPLDAASYTDSALWAEDIAAVIRAKSLEQPVLVGWSYGGYVIADYIRVHGDKNIGGLVLVGTSARIGSEEAEGDLGEEFLEGIGGALSDDVLTNIESTRAFLHLVTAQPLDDDAFALAFGSAMMVPPEVRRSMFSRQVDNDEVLSGIDTPTLIIHGGNDRIVRLRSSEHVAETVPGAELLVYDGAGHAPFLEIPERFNRDLAKFVRRVRTDASD